MKKIFYGWWIVLATSLIHFWGGGTFFYSFTAFFNPIVDEFGWSYAATSFAASLRSIEGGIASPIVGAASDRYGARILLFIGSILGGFGFILLSQVNSLYGFYILFIFLSIGTSLLFPVPGWTAVTNWFEKKRGLAMGMLSGSIGVGGVLVYFVSWLIGVYGWRTTMIIIGIVMVVIGIPCSLVVRHRPEPYGLSPDGETGYRSVSSGVKETVEDQSRSHEGFSVRQAMKTRAFWILTFAVTISGATTHAVVVHVMPYLISIDFTRNIAGVVAALIVFVSVIGRLGLGWLTTSMNSRYLLAFGLFLQALGMLVLGMTQTFWQAMLFILLFGPGYGGVITLRLTMQAEYFGRLAFGAIQGAIMAIMIVGTMSSPLLAGLYYDIHGSYRGVWLIMAAIILLGIPFTLKVSPPKRKNLTELVKKT